jgi:ribosomal protein S18 acetylase RimI-like enzyme
MTFTFTLTDIADENTRKKIVAPLIAFNERAAGPSNYKPLVVSLQDSQGEVAGGLWGFTAFGWLTIQLLAVPESARGSGVGTTLMTMAETEAVARGCDHAWLDTHEFQARGFYERLGYRLFGELPDFPTGFKRFFLQKALAMPRAG